MRFVLVFLSVLATVVANPLAQATPPAPAKPMAQSAKRHFLWAIRPPGAPPTYLMGSLHLLKPEYYPLSPTIEQAFASAKVLIEEVDLDELSNPLAAMPLMAKAVFTDGRTLEQVIAPDLHKQVVARADKAGVPIFVINRMKPWMAAISLTAPALKAAGYDPALGIDKYFFDKAKTLGLERRGLETMAYQFDRFDQMPLPIQETMLRAVIADIDTQLSNVKTIADAWLTGDVAAIERLLLGAFTETPELSERLLVERNRNWVEPVERCIREKTPCFVVVGAAHLVGPNSLVDLLRQKGHVVEQQ